MQEAIKQAIKGGFECEYAQYDLRTSSCKSEIMADRYEALLNPEFWKALYGSVNGVKGGLDGNIYTSGPYYEMHRFIDHLIDGKDIDSFFSKLTKKDGSSE